MAMKGKKPASPDQPATVVSDVGQFAMVPTWLLMSGVSDRAVRLFAFLGGKYANFKSGEAVATRRALANDLGCSVSSADRAIDELTKARALVVTQRQGAHGDFISNIYKLRITTPEGQRPEDVRVGQASEIEDPAAPSEVIETEGGVYSPVTIPLVTGEQGVYSPVNRGLFTGDYTRDIGTRSDQERTEDYSAENHGASRSPVEKSEPTTWTRGLAIAHRVREDYPKDPGNWLSEIKARMLNQGIDANDQGPDGTKFFIRVWDEMLKQVKHRKGDGGVIAWRHRHAARQAGQSSKRRRLDTS